MSGAEQGATQAFAESATMESATNARLTVEWMLAIRDGDHSHAVDVALAMLDRCTCGTREPCPF